MPASIDLPESQSVLSFLQLREVADCPQYQQLYEAIQQAILDGKLKPEDRLPSVRALASHLKISRDTVVRAFRLLVGHGYLISGVKSRLIVSATIDTSVSSCEASNTIEPGLVSPVPVPLASSIPADLADLAVQLQSNHCRTISSPSLIVSDESGLQQWRRIFNKQLRSVDKHTGDSGDSLGDFRFRQSIATMLRTSGRLFCDASQVAIFGSPLVALDFIVRMLGINGASVVVEDPSLRSIQDLLTQQHATIVPTNVDENGIDLSTCTGINANLMIVSPNQANPSGAQLSEERRQLLINWASRQQTAIIENGCYDDFYSLETPFASLTASYADIPVIYWSSFCPMLSPLTKLAYVVFPPAMLSQARTLRDTLGCDAALVEQRVMTDFILEGLLDRHVSKVRHLFKGISSQASFSLDRQLTEDVLTRRGFSGHQAYLEFAPDIPIECVTEAANLAGLPLFDASEQVAGSSNSHKFVMPFGSFSEQSIQNLVARFAAHLSKIYAQSIKRQGTPANLHC